MSTPEVQQYYINNKEKIDTRVKISRKNNPELWKEYSRQNFLKRRYGYSNKEYDKQFELQNGLCAICNQPETVLIAKNKKAGTRRLSVDHNHITNKIRELLCNKCNRVLGLAQDSIKILKEATVYLNLHSGNPEYSIYDFDGLN